MRLKKNYVVCFFVLLALTLSACKSAYVPYDYKLDKYITLGEYTGISYDYVNIGVNDSDLQQAIWNDMQENGYGENVQIASGEVLQGDVLTLDIRGKIADEIDPDLAATNVSLVVGDGTFLDEFESKLIGEKIGDTSTIEVTFPDDYIKVAYAGKTAIYFVEIHSAQRLKCPELTDAIVADISNYATVAEYTDAMQKKLEQQAVVNADEEIEQLVWDKVVAGATVTEYPEKAIEYLKSRIYKEFEDAASEKEQTFSEFLKENKFTKDEFESYALNRAQKVCKEEMVMHAIARAEKLEVSSGEIKQLAQTYADTYDFASLKDLYKVHSKEMIEQTVLFQKVKDFVVASAKQIV